MGVSIHAPAWGATLGELQERVNYLVSIHAPAWGATLGVRYTGEANRKFQSTHPRGVRHSDFRDFSLETGCFNPRTRVGCDAETIEQRIDLLIVSIHAPAWGAT
ncbi:hypothetical protein Holit_02998 [Hollandina sp. SP2]